MLDTKVMVIGAVFTWISALPERCVLFPAAAKVAVARVPGMREPPRLSWMLALIGGVALEEGVALVL